MRHISFQFKTFLSSFIIDIDDHVSDAQRKRNNCFGQLNRTAEKKMFKVLQKERSRGLQFLEKDSKTLHIRQEKT